MAVAVVAVDYFDTQNDNQLVSASVAGTGTDRAVLVIVKNADGSVGAPNACNWNAAGGDQALTELINVNHDTFYNSAVYGIVGQDSESATVTVDFTGSDENLWGIVVTLSGVLQTSAAAAFSSIVREFSGDESVSVTGQGDDDLIIDMIYGEGASAITEGTNQTELATEVSITAGSTAFRYSGSQQDGADGAVMSWTVTGSSNTELVAVLVKAAAVVVTGTITPTLENFTSAGTGAMEVTGTSTQTLSAFTSTASGTFGPTGSISQTLDGFTSTASGSSSAPGVTPSGTIAVTLDVFTSSSAGVYADTGTIATTLDPFTSNISGAVEVTGTITVTMGNFTAFAEGIGDPAVGSSFNFNRGGVIAQVVRKRK